MSRNSLNPPPHRLRADAALLGVAFIWGITFSLVKEALTDGPPCFFLALRFLIATIILSPFTLRGTGWPWRSGALLGILLAAGYITQTIGLQSIEPGRSAFLTGLAVVFVPLLGGLFRWDRLSRWDLFGTFLAWVGVTFLTGWIFHPGGRWQVGDLLTLACAVTFALHILVVGRSSPRHSILRLTWIQIVTATILLGAGAFIFEPQAFQQAGNPVSGSPTFLGISTLFLFAAAGTGLFATALAFLTQIRMQRETTPTHTAVIFTMEPVFAALFSIVVRHETAGLAEILGALLILTGIFSVQLGRSHQQNRRIKWQSIK
ncbi:MAG: DMT family transporter [Candidatus Eisenbacteria bacterium]|uniref:DMT family transporter n=1 Tax=Eiseniibacteriota bacterium TaxID=2212470 RepID=A0A948RZR0_UNCEI|nr:DMT family transporter [Candidatus Eisenbacteria bacterium]MBU1949405.1 DMT family transporter [Candidatus Eisenbacteria bacterium]MBU2691204.1 DMT family transporter [Candidatus Eisenbacteria bacterium]